MPRTPPPAPSQDSIRDFVGYFSTLSTPHRNVGRGDTGGTSRLNQSAVSNSTTSTESTHSIDTASPSVSGTRRMRLRRRHSAASSDTSATLSVSTTAHTTTTAEEESRVERELTVAPVPAPRPGLRVRLRLRPPETRDCHTGHSTSPGSEKRQQQEEEDDDEEYVDGPKARTRYGKKRRTNRVDSPLEDVKPLEGKRKRRIRMASSVPGSRESTASLGSMAPRSSHGRNTRSSTLVAEPVQTLESVEAANKALDTRLRQIGLRVFNVASDGNCLFRVFAHQLFNDPNRHLELRTAICDYLKTHADTLSCYNWNEHGESYEQYVARMRKSRVWGGYLELYAFTQLYACRLIIYESDREQVFGEGDDVPEDAKVVRLSYHGGVHYNSVVPATPSREESPHYGQSPEDQQRGGEESSIDLDSPSSSEQ
ncbi:hypothetical protein NCC49_005761 [Naganishia albida]|nr:hypothetical protein NCC49_005761 [Naganishia albida]